MIRKAKYVTEITVIDPDSKLGVELAIYKHENGGMFAIDSSYVEQVLDEDNPIIPDPFCDEPDDSVELSE